MKLYLTDSKIPFDPTVPRSLTVPARELRATTGCLMAMAPGRNRIPSSRRRERR